MDPLHTAAMPAVLEVKEERMLDGPALPAAYVAETLALHYLATDGAGIILYCNRAVSSRLHQPAERLIGRPVWSLLTAPDAATLRRWLRSGATPSPHHLLLNFVDAGAHPYTLQCSLFARADGLLLLGEPTLKEEGALVEQLVAANNDLAVLTRENTARQRELARTVARLQIEIAERQEAERALRTAAEALQTLSRAVEQSPASVLITDPAGVLIYVNPHCCRLSGFAAEELIAQPARLVKFGHLTDEAYQALWDTLTAGEIWIGEVLNRKKDGTPYWELASMSGIRYAGGTIIHCVGVLEDITERKRREEAAACETAAARRRSTELEEENRRVLEASRLKCSFLANMSHEFRTPLGAITGFAELLYEGRVGPVSDDHQQIIGNILSSARHLTQIVNDVLDLAKVEAGKINFRPEPVDVAQTVREVRDVLQTLTARKHLRIVTRIDRRLGQVEVDPVRLKQVLYNYVSNAIKFTPEGGQISMSFAPCGDGMFRLAVRDTGIGIAPAAIAQLFTEFTQLDNQSEVPEKGTGLGLALTKRIVEAQGGTVGVRSTLGKGSTFSAVLPRRPQPARHQPAASMIQASRGSGRSLSANRSRSTTCVKEASSLSPLGIPP